MKKIIALFTSIIVVIISGCATMPKSPPQTMQRISATINAPKDKVWSLIISEIGLEFPVQALEKESGLITTQFVSIPVGFNNSGMERYVFKPGGWLATWRGLRMKMSVLVVEIDTNTTMITIRAHYEAFENNVTHSWIVAETNGSVENRIITSIESKI